MKYHKTVYQSFALITQFGITMIVPIFLCSLLGWYLDEQFQTSWLFITLFFVGALAGFRNIYIMSKQIMEAKDDTMENKRKRGCTNTTGEERKGHDEKTQRYE